MAMPIEEATSHLVSEDSLLIDKSLLKTCAVASIDRGSTLTKILYTTAVTGGSGDAAKVELRLALFRNKHFESGLEFLKSKLQGGSADDKKLSVHVTGVGANLFGDKIKEILGADAQFIDEVYCQLAGFHFMLSHYSLEQICFPPPQADEILLAGFQRGETFQRLRDAQAAQLQSQAAGEKFPCLYAICGSSAGVVLVNEDGSIVVKHRHLLAGKSFLGLCQLLIGTCDYQEIMRLAAVGKRGNIDTQIRDILADNPNSPYGRMPPTMPFFPFGKAVDFDKSLEDTRREDVAQSLVSSFTLNFSNVVGFIATYEKVRNVFYGGNFFQDEFPRRELATAAKLFGTGDIMKIHFLKTGHTAALGALLGSPRDVTDFFADMQIKG